MTGADLRDANLGGANLSGANLTKAKLNKVALNLGGCPKLMPKGWSCVKGGDGKLAIVNR